MRAFLEERLQLSLLFQIQLGGKCNTLLLLSTQKFQNKGISCASPGALSICMEKLFRWEIMLLDEICAFCGKIVLFHLAVNANGKCFCFLGWNFPMEIRNPLNVFPHLLHQFQGRSQYEANRGTCSVIFFV